MALAAPALKAAHYPERLPDDADDPRHIVDILLEERCQTMLQNPFWWAHKAVLYPLLRYRRAIRMADTIAPLSAWAGFQHLSDTLAMKMTTTGIGNIPETGRIIIASTHPTGIADGIAMFDALKARRPDMVFYANRDALRAAPQLGEMIIPVEWLVEKRTRERSRETLAATRQAFADERCVVIFPSGRLAYIDKNKRMVEQEWMSTVVSLARKYKCDIIPTSMTGRNSWLYYWFRNLGPELRDITLFNELLNKKGKSFHVTFGERISWQDLAGNVDDVTAALREHALSDVLAGRAWKNPKLTSEDSGQTRPVDMPSKDQTATAMT